MLPAAVFVVVAVALTWLTAAVCPSPSPESGLLRASLIYAAVVGWQPLAALAIARRVFDQRRRIDYGLRPITPRYSVLSVALAAGVLATAAIVDALVRTPAAAAPTTLDLSWSHTVASVAALSGVVAVLWLQAIAEELGWRGYLLPRLMRTIGPWPGLVVHGALWGICYAPVFLVNGEPERVGAFVVTCALLGVVLGWLRLTSGSIYASAASNAMLTICAGLPLVLQGTSSIASAVFSPIGWLPLLVVIAAIASRASWRAAVVAPSPAVPDYVN